MSHSKQIHAGPSLVIFGAGGHGRVLVDAALLMRRWSRIVVSDRKLPDNRTELLMGVDLLAVAAALALDASIHVAIGNNQFRQREANALGIKQLISVVHPAAVISIFSNVGAGCFVAAGAVIGPLALLGLGVIVNHGAVIDHDTEVGSFSHIAPNATLSGHVKVGQRVLIGSGATVLPSIVIGDDVIVGAGSLVDAHILNAGTYAGIPAKKVS